MTGRPYDENPPERSGERGEPDFWSPPDPSHDSFSAWSDGADTTPLPQAATAPPPDVLPQVPHWPYPYPSSAPPDRTGYAAPPPSHLVWAILGIFLGFWPLGLVATVKAASVSRLWAQNRVEDAWRASRLARRLAVGAFVVQGFFFLGMVFLPLFVFGL
ncbi:hypothetical protein N865_21775 [Intrasporangium oryzae NRRL B-24470]|uniref:Interferon-induced transmembrane protein n=1 Tax=Intrasporangium oryzae NRRL B-24470 TaxID=1386089 RepID=W9G6Y6_9MICO|nr:CD225/dispanin family protein [Intrasporangium oryzae]EWS99633.1 hypothetical protein N865_21775 [Intrasporangium oryzae NRRL B-24470]